MHVDRCICAEVPRFDLRTRLVVVMHKRERAKTTSTARLAATALVNSAVVVRGLPDAPEPDWGALVPADHQAFLLFPSEAAAPLSRAMLDGRPVVLVVPDGSWRQASKVHRREPALAGLPHVTLPPAAPTRFRLRREPVEGGLATCEAIARAFGILEDPSVQQRLEAAFDALVEGTLATRGVRSSGAPG